MSTASLALLPVRGLARLGVLPVRALARVRPPAVDDPGALRPENPPPTDGRLLLLFDGGCGICLHARDVMVDLDRGRHLAHDRIARHDRGLLSDLSEEERYGSWHVVHPDGRVESGGAGLTTVVGALPGGRPLAALMRRVQPAVDRGYMWFADNRGWISQGSGLINHPQRDPREQPDHPRHAEVVLGEQIV